MIKTIALIKRKEGITREEFARHYEEVHAPLALKHLPMIKRYIRNHISDIPGVKGPDFDCISEFWFDSIEDAIKVQEYVESETGREIRKDEARFQDKSKIVSFLVEEKISEI